MFEISPLLLTVITTELNFERKICLFLKKEFKAVALSYFRSNKHKFSTMCLLSDSWEKENTEDIEFVIANRESSEVALTKWTLDSFCL